MGIRGRRWMQEEFSWEAVAHKMAETYEWLLRGKQRPEWVFVN